MRRLTTTTAMSAKKNAGTSSQIMALSARTLRQTTAVTEPAPGLHERQRRYLMTTSFWCAVSPPASRRKK